MTHMGLYVYSKQLKRHLLRFVVKPLLLFARSPSPPPPLPNHHYMYIHHTSSVLDIVLPDQAATTNPLFPCLGRHNSRPEAKWNQGFFSHNVKNPWLRDNTRELIRLLPFPIRISKYY
jgi:hypothetical protein